MNEEFDLLTAPIAALGAETTSFVDWQETLREAAVTSYTHCVSSKVAVEAADFAISDIEKKFPDKAHYFAAKSYISDAMRITAARKCLLVGGHFLIVFGDDQIFCAAESVSHDLKVGVEKLSATTKVLRNAGQFNIKINVNGDVGKMPDSREYLNIYLCPWNNYGHWHVHNLSFVEVLRGIVPGLLSTYGAKGIRLICHALSDHFLPELKEFTVARLREICPVDVWGNDRLKEPLWLDNVIVCSSSVMVRGCRWPAAYKQLFRRLRVPRDAGGPELIYCDRSHAGRRGIDNEDAVKESLKRVGFMVLKPGDMSLAEQRRAFSNARVIVGSHGAALTNMIYSHVQPSVVELTHDRYGRPHYEWFQYLAGVMGLRYLPLMHKLTEEQRQQEFYLTDFTVDTDALISAMQLMGVIDRSGR